jgi:hypothetical protein
MEAINNIASAATKAIWGEPAKGDIAPSPVNQEPISGVQGNPSKGEPFDAGNAQENNITVGGEQSQANPSAAQASSTTTGDSTKAQIDTRDPADEQTSPSVATRKNDVNNVEPLDPSIVKGPGPKPLDQVAREHGGDAGNAAHDAASSSARAEGQAPSPNAAGGAAPEEGKKLEREGTGEKLVRSSGLVADGGDFDAANPGAGREADSEPPPLYPPSPAAVRAMR